MDYDLANQKPKGGKHLLTNFNQKSAQHLIDQSYARKVENILTKQKPEEWKMSCPIRTQKWKHLNQSEARRVEKVLSNKKPSGKCFDQSQATTVGKSGQIKAILVCQSRV